jgi:hypothetical protein
MDASRLQANDQRQRVLTRRKLSRNLAATAVQALALLLVSAGIAAAGELYGSAGLGISGGFADAGGSTPFFDNTGSDSDSSPTYSATFGFEAPMNEPLPENWQSKVPNWPVMVEIEFTGGRDYEFLTDGADPYRSEVTSWTVFNNARFDLPLYVPIEWAFGRLPILEPMSFYTKVGIGMAINDVATTDNVSRGSDTILNFAWQAGGGLAYEISENISVSVGYNYVDLGDSDVKLAVGPTAFGNHSLHVSAHELSTALRVRFYPIPLSLSRGR